MLPRLLVGAAVFAVAYNGGTYGTAGRAALGVAVWWLILVGVARGDAVPRTRSAATATLACLAVLALWTGLSAVWGNDPLDALAEADRVFLYAGILLLALRSSDDDRAASADGIVVGVVATAAVGVASRLLPRLFADGAIPTVIPPTPHRLSFPVGYWNGLGVLAAVCVPLLLRVAVLERRRVSSAAAVGAIPLLAAALYLSASRSGVALAVGGAVAFAIVCGRFAESAKAILIAAAGAAGAVAVVATTPGVEVGFPHEPSAGRGALALAGLAAACVAAALASSANVRIRLPAITMPRTATTTAAVVLAVATLVGVLAVVDVEERARAFARPPESLAQPTPGLAGQHLMSGSGGGRWQFWTAAWNEFRAHPVLGGGAGSFAGWWREHRTFEYSVHDAHSLELETLAELGPVGLLLLLGALGAAIVGLVRRVRSANEGSRPLAAALVVAFAVFVLGSAIDWLWELTVVPAVAFACLGLGLQTDAEAEPRYAPRRVVVGGAAAALAAQLALLATVL